MVIDLELRGTGAKDFVKALQDRAQSSKNLANTKIKVVSNAEYSGYVDQGTIYMEAQPFFQTTLESHKMDEIGPDPTPDKVKQYANKIANEMKSKAPVDTGYLQSNIEVQGA